MRSWACDAAAVLAFAAALLCASTATASPAPGGAVAAMMAVPHRYDNGILQVSGKLGAPDPSAWEIIVRDVDDGGTAMKLTVAGGQILSEHPSLDLGEMFQESGYIDRDGLGLDSGDVFEIAKKYAAANGKSLGVANYKLTKKGEDEPPVWTLDCFDLQGKSIGQLQVISTSGAVVSHRGFDRAP